MKKHRYEYYYLLSAVLLFFSGFNILACKGSPSSLALQAKDASSGQIIPFQLHTKETSIPLLPSRGATSPQMRFSLVLLELPRQREIEELVEKTFYDGEDPQSYGNRLINQHKANYLEMVHAITEHSDTYESLNWEYNEVMDISFPLPGMAVVSRSREYYLGGAHGMQEKKYVVINTERNKQVKLDDLMKKGYQTVLLQQIEAELRTLTGIKKTAPLREGGFFEDTVTIPENFFIVPGGLGFHWDPYEIAPYSMGPVEITIPFEKLQDVLRIYT
ncbi:MAG: RsiV family protein [Spirochaetaceae bacterium]|nr:RsiV family protein [Spirochaetaceae bacterium]